MNRLEQLVMHAALGLAVLSGCNQPKHHAAPDPIVRDPAAESAPSREAPPAPVPAPRIKAYGTLMFHAEVGDVRTSACLSLDEIPAQSGYDGVELVFDSLIEAFKSKDDKAYNALTIAEQSGAGTKCPHTMKEFFSRFEDVALQRIDHVYAFDNVVLVDTVLRMSERDVTLAFGFEHTSEGKLEYAPCPDRTPFHAAVRSWLSDPRVGEEFNPQCPSDVVERATHRIPFGADPARPGALLLRGAPVNEPGDLRDTAARVAAALKSIERAVAANDMRGLQKHMAKKGREVAEWWPTATPQERARYSASLTGVEPFFIFDASPLVIGYVRQGGVIQVMYFVSGADGRLIWTNSTLFTHADGLFKRGPLSESAAALNPFSNYRVK